MARDAVRKHGPAIYGKHARNATKTMRIKLHRVASHRAAAVQLASRYLFVALYLLGGCALQVRRRGRNVAFKVGQSQNLWFHIALSRPLWVQRQGAPTLEDERPTAGGHHHGAACPQRALTSPGPNGAQRALNVTRTQRASDTRRYRQDSQEIHVRLAKGPP